MLEPLTWSRAAVDAWRGESIHLRGDTLRVPGGRRIRLSVVAGNVRLHRLLERFVAPGATVVDVGANIGYNTVRAARLAGPRGRVVALEPAPDNLAVLARNIASAGVHNVEIAPVAAGRGTGTRDLYLRGELSAVNSFYPRSCYATVTQKLAVAVVPLDALVDAADVVKIDVEGAELDVLEGMPRLLAGRRTVLIVEWHPLLQTLAGFSSDALPRWLLARGWRLSAASHWATRRFGERELDALTARLLRQRRPVEIVARR